MPLGPDTDSREVAVDAFERLTPVEQRFVEARLAGKTLAQSYYAAHPKSKAQPDSAKADGYKLSRRRPVQLAMDEARRCAALSGIETYEDYLARGLQLEQISVDRDQMSAAVRAYEVRGKAAGHVPGGGSGGGSPMNFDGAPGPHELVMSIRATLGDQVGRLVALKLGLQIEDAPLIDAQPVELAE
jgi:hypothetical protein